jgi:hypothetical protein
VTSVNGAGRDVILCCGAQTAVRGKTASVVLLRGVRNLAV